MANETLPLPPMSFLEQIRTGTYGQPHLTVEGYGYNSVGNFTTTTFGSVLGDISSFVKSTFLPVYQVTHPAPITLAGQTPAPQPTGQPSPGLTLDLRSMLLIGGVCVFGVGLILLMRKSRK